MANTQPRSDRPPARWLELLRTWAKKHTWPLLSLWFSIVVAGFWLEPELRKGTGTYVFASMFLAGSVFGLPLAAFYQTTGREWRMSAGAALENFMDRWGWKLLWFGGGAVSFAVAVSSAARAKPLLSQPWMLPTLFLFGSFAIATALDVALGRLTEWAVNREPGNSLHPGQFGFCFLAALGLGAVTCVFLVVAFLAALGLAGALDPQKYAGWKTAIPWIAGAFFSLSALWAAVVPFYAMFLWFASRRELERMRDDALFKLAKVVGEHSDPGSSTESDRIS